MAKLQLQGSESAEESPEMVLARNKPLMEHITSSSPVLHVLEEIRVNHEVSVHRETFLKSLLGPLPKDRNGETQDKLCFSSQLESTSPDTLGDNRRTTNTSVSLYHFPDHDQASITCVHCRGRDQAEEARTEDRNIKSMCVHRH